MHCIAHSLFQDSNTDVQLKQHSACFEQGGFDKPPSAPTDLTFAHFVADGLNPDIHLGASATKERKEHKVGDRTPILRIGRYLLLEQLDNLATLYKSVNTETQDELVCKVINKKDSQKILSAYFRMDAHEHINEVQEVIIGETKTYIFLPHNYGDLYSYVRKKRRLREPEAQQLFRQVAKAVSHCHENGIVLRDLKLRKFVFKDAERTQLKLESLEDAVTFDEDDSLGDKHGCPAYVSPQLLTASDSYSGCSADAWSLGVMLYTMLVGRYPFHDNDPNVLFTKIRRGHFVVPEWLSSKARCMIRGLLRQNPDERLTASDILLHPWLRPGSAADLLPHFKCEAKVPDQTVPSGNSVSMFELASAGRIK
uniref:Protein kinase domain-containing protein n=1 Tax=Strigamia maritima TaxID=126957 RepID=T1JD19_STRMM